MKHFGSASVAWVALWLTACATLPYPPLEIPAAECGTTSAVTETVFLIGDTGDPDVSEDPETGAVGIVDPVLSDLYRDVTASVAALGAGRTVVVYLGDNVYPKGLRPEGHPARDRDLEILRAQIAAVGTAKGFFIAGNHDWDREGPAGWDHVVDQGRFFEPYGPQIEMLPPAGCAGPSVVDVGDHLRLVFLDVIGWIHAVHNPREHRRSHCPHMTSDDTYYALADEFDHPDGRHVALLTHHPLITTGPHGGHFTWKEHLFPLRDVLGSNWWVPLPVIGSLYPISRWLGVTGTDVSSDVYQRYLRAIDRTSRPGVPMLAAAGHEHSLQVHRDANDAFYLVSGAGSPRKVDRVSDAPTALMGLAEPGYMRLDLHADGSIGLRVLALAGGEPRREVYSACVAEGPPRTGRRIQPAQATE